MSKQEFSDLELNNGQTAKFLYVDDWHRPVYKLENGRKVCCTELRGVHLHTMSPDIGEPEFPLTDDFQPKPED